MVSLSVGKFTITQARAFTFEIRSFQCLSSCSFSMFVLLMLSADAADAADAFVLVMCRMWTFRI